VRRAMTDDASMPRDHAFMPKPNHGFLSIIGLPPLAAGACGNGQKKRLTLPRPRGFQ
jgi:hypothetical protein